jgi:formylglycine-generating enzyme required for sulfatase activity
MQTTRIFICFYIFVSLFWFFSDAFGQSRSTQIPEGITMVSIPAGSFTMGNNNAVGPLAAAHMPERTVTIGAFQMSEAETTNEQYVTFLNATMADGLIKIGTGVSMGQAAVYVVGNDGQDYAEQRFIELSGSRVLKDHDGDGTIDPENPLNQCWIEYDEATNQFSVKDPQAIDWDNYPYESGESRADWDELAAGNLPSLDEVKQWPVSFIKWYGA